MTRDQEFTIHSTSIAAAALEGCLTIPVCVLSPATGNAYECSSCMVGPVMRAHLSSQLPAEVYCLQCRASYRAVLQRDTTADKTEQVHQFPAILCIQLKRFYFTERVARKIVALVTAPVQALDCSTFAAVPLGRHVYDLVSVVNHSGESVLTGVSRI